MRLPERRINFRKVYLKELIWKKLIWDHQYKTIDCGNDFTRELLKSWWAINDTRESICENASKTGKVHKRELIVEKLNEIIDTREFIREKFSLEN